MSAAVFDCRFKGGWLDGRTRHLTEAPIVLDVWRHRHQPAVVEIGLGRYGARQSDLWEGMDYTRTDCGDGYADYEARSVTQQAAATVHGPGSADDSSTDACARAETADVPVAQGGE